MSQVSFYPLFRIDLIQMFRHGEVRQAIRRAGAEFRLAEKAAKKGGGKGDGGGVIMVPTPERAIQLGYANSLPAPDFNQQPGGYEL